MKRKPPHDHTSNSDNTEYEKKETNEIDLKITYNSKKSCSFRDQQKKLDGLKPQLPDTLGINSNLRSLMENFRGLKPQLPDTLGINSNLRSLMENFRGLKPQLPDTLGMNSSLLSHMDIDGLKPQLPDTLGMNSSLFSHMDIDGLKPQLPDTLGMNSSLLSHMDILDGLKPQLPDTLGMNSSLRNLMENFRGLKPQLPDTLGMNSSLLSHMDIDGLKPQLPDTLGMNSSLRSLMENFRGLKPQLPDTLGMSSSLRSHMDIDGLKPQLPDTLGMNSSLHSLMENFRGLKPQLPDTLGMSSSLQDSMKGVDGPIGRYADLNDISEIAKKASKIAAEALTSNNQINVRYPYEDGVNSYSALNKKTQDLATKLVIEVFNQKLTEIINHKDNTPYKNLAAQIAALQASIHSIENDYTPLRQHIKSFAKWILGILLSVLLAAYIGAGLSSYGLLPVPKETHRKNLKIVSQNYANSYPNTKIWIVKVDSRLNVRMKPNKKSLVIGKLYPYTGVLVEKKTKKWSKIRYCNQQTGCEISGWVFSKHLKKIK
ncbi:hypothetical protein [Maridesulfovibrio sp.]|uniref:hypothetical protein n=1 Tax=unclassified Maridesulfovibrio TaxID=2794999 RepID=UPI003AFFD87B